ncbi:DMT family transporter [Ochrobactrum teleogrylli]|uniref:DMT family transporter n=1 Tax=Ochrobactrum teleogrylli TaxID=2479765 RepID=A0ABY2Y6G6_9HYPH|nr:DMT family transporter [[Ochrobactrum] teleogrylli]TNV16137.1 DMT family transporter [[Ochrobactrum] teleogrylli]
MSVLGFSLKSIFIKLSMESGYSASSIMGLRMLISFPLFLAALLFVKKKEDIGNGSIKTIIVCACLYYISGMADISGLEYIPVSLERTLLFSIPMFTMLISFFLERKTYSKRAILFCGLSWAGIAVSFIEGDKISSGATTVYGAGLVIISAASYSFYMVVSANGIKRFGPVGFNARTMLVAALPSIAPLTAMNEPTLISHHLNGMLMPICLALFSTVFPSFFLAWGIKRCGPSLVAGANNLGPFITMFAGYLCLGEKITPKDIVGMVIVVISIFFLSKEIMKKKRNIEGSDIIGFGKGKWYRFGRLQKNKSIL